MFTEINWEREKKQMDFIARGTIDRLGFQNETKKYYEERMKM